jgi:hypothetical protein
MREQADVECSNISHIGGYACAFPGLDGNAL